MLGAGVDPRMFVQDYSGFTRAAEIQAQGMQNLGEGIGKAATQVGDYFKQQGEKKKLVKQSSLQIDAALQLFPDLAPSFQGLKERMRDENIPLSDRAAEAEVVANLINMGVGEMRNRSNMSIQREKAMAEATYKEQELGMEERRTRATEYRASQAGQPSYQLEKPIITGPDGRSYESKTPMPYNPKTGRFFDAAKGKEILDINEWGLDKPSYVDGEAMPTPTSQNDIIAPSTAYSFGKAVGGPDELQDKWTNKGYTSTGPNLVEGVVAVNTNKYPLGTIFKDSESGKVYVAADRHGNKDSGVIDFFQNPENYTGGKTNRRLSIIGSIPKNKIPKTKEGMSQLIEQYSNVPDYSTSSNASQIDGALSMGGDMSQQAMGTPDQQAEVARMIEEGSGMATSQAAPSGAMPTEPRMAQPQPTQQAPQYKVRPGFVPVGNGASSKFRPANAEEVSMYGTQGQVNVETGQFTPIRPASGMVIEQTSGGGFRVVQGAGATDRFAQASKEAEKQKLQAADRNIQDLMEAKRLYSSVMQSKGVIPAAARKLEAITPGTELHAIQKDIIEPFKNRLGLEQLTQLRQASPTGAAVGNPTNAEGQRLESVFGSLDPTASPTIFNRNLNRAIESYLDVIHGTPEQRDKLMEEGKITAKQNAEIEAQYPSSTMDTMGIEQPRQTGGTGNPAIDEIIQRNNIQIK